MKSIAWTVPVSQLCERCGQPIHGHARRRCDGHVISITWRSHPCVLQERHALGKRGGETRNMYSVAKLLKAQ